MKYSSPGGDISYFFSKGVVDIYPEIFTKQGVDLIIKYSDHGWLLILKNFLKLYICQS